MPMFKSEQTPIHPYRVAYELNEFLTDDTIYIGDGGDVVTDFGAGGAAALAGQLDGSGRARLARCRHRLRDGGEARRTRTRKCSATTATARSA